MATSCELMDGFEDAYNLPTVTGRHNSDEQGPARSSPGV